MSPDDKNGPTRAVPVPSKDPVAAAEWFRATFGEMPAPTPDMDPPHERDGDRDRQRSVLAQVERTIPPAYRWARFNAPELAQRVASPAALAQAQKAWREPRVCLTGPSLAGKTSLAVAMLRLWAGDSGRPAAFIHACLLGMARLIHPIGRGEPDLVEQAMRAPLVLLDDLGNERDTPTNAIPDVIFVRHMENRPTWVTTGMSRRQLATRYGTGVVNRLFERSVVIPVGAPAARENSC